MNEEGVGEFGRKESLMSTLQTTLVVVVFTTLNLNRRYFDLIYSLYSLLLARSVIFRNVGDQKHDQYNDGPGQPVLNSRKIKMFFFEILFRSELD